MEGAEAVLFVRWDALTARRSDVSQVNAPLLLGSASCPALGLANQQRVILKPRPGVCHRLT